MFRQHLVVAVQHGLQVLRQHLVVAARHGLMRRARTDPQMGDVVRRRHIWIRPPSELIATRAVRRIPVSGPISQGGTGSVAHRVVTGGLTVDNRSRVIWRLTVGKR